MANVNSSLNDSINNKAIWSWEYDLIISISNPLNFFENWSMDRHFHYLAVFEKKKIIKIYTYINVICIKSKNCKFLQNLGTDFLVALSSETPWVFTLFSLKQRKFTV